MFDQKKVCILQTALDLFTNKVVHAGEKKAKEGGVQPHLPSCCPRSVLSSPAAARPHSSTCRSPGRSLEHLRRRRSPCHRWRATPGSSSSASAQPWEKRKGRWTTLTSPWTHSLSRATRSLCVALPWRRRLLPARHWLPPLAQTSAHRSLAAG